MPTYEYRCPNGHDFERFSKISESQSTLPCPQCGAIAERRISGGAGLVFKGSGFYITDYGKDGKKDQKAPAAAAEKSGGGEAASGGGESKSDAKSGGDAKPAAPAPSAASTPSSTPSKPSKPSSSSSSGGDS